MNNHSTNSHLKYRVLPLVLAILANIDTVSPALAQGEKGLEEIVVTAERREQSLQDTPIAITAFTANKLTDLGIYEVTSLASYSPNVAIERSPGSSSNMSTFMRGVGSKDTTVIGDPKVGMYVDGVLVSKTLGSTIDFIDLERVEVLRGPQGTLFGRNTTGGAISITTQKPTGELRAKAQASLGNFGYRRLNGSIDLPAVAGVAAKLSYGKVESDGWAVNRYRGLPVQPATTVEKDLGSKNEESYRIALRWTPRDDLAFDYAYEHTDNHDVPAPFQIVKVKDRLYNGFTWSPLDFQLLGGDLFQQMAATVGNPKKRRRVFSLDGVTEDWLKVKGHTFTAAWDASEQLTLKYIYGKRITESGYDSSDLDGGAYVARDLFYGVNQGNDGPIPKPGFHAAIDGGRIDMETHELQLIGSAFSDRLHYTGGIFRLKEEGWQDNPQTFSLPIAFVSPKGAGGPLGPLYDAAGFCPPAYGGAVCIGTQRMPLPIASDAYIRGMNDFYYGQQAESFAVYGQGTYSLTDRLDLTAGIRYTKDKKKAFLYSQSIAGFTKQDPIRGHDDWNNVSYRLNGRYVITENISTYLTYATGYNGGGLNARAANVAAFQAPYQEEKVATWELGVKSEFFDRSARLNAAIFHNKYSDMQITQTEPGSGGATSRIVNAGKAAYYGAELDGAIVLFDQLTIEFTYGYLKADFDKYEARNPATDLIENIASRVETPFAPTHSSSVGVQYDFSPTRFGSLSARVDATYRGAYVFDPIQNFYDGTESRTLVNARLSLNEIPLGSDAGVLQLSLWGKNLTDEEYRVYSIDFASLGFAGTTYGEPRTYGLDLIYTWK